MGNKMAKMTKDDTDTTIIVGGPDGNPQVPVQGYLSDEQISSAIQGLKKYIKNCSDKKKADDRKRNKKLDLLEAGEKNLTDKNKIFVEVIFKNIPSNSRTYIHNVVLPHHWCHGMDSEDINMAVFVKHIKPKTEAQKIQFARDRDLDITNTHDHYQAIFDEKLTEATRAKISRIITTKELATEYNTFQKLDRLAKTYDIFVSDKQLMANKMNPLPRRLGRRFWVREKKVPRVVRLDGSNLENRFKRALSTEQFYVIGRSSTERIQIGVFGQSNTDLKDNMKAFLNKLFAVYGSCVRYIKVRSNLGMSLPIYADMSSSCPRVLMREKKEKLKPVIDDFDMLKGNAKIKVYPDGHVRVLRKKKPTKRKADEESPAKHVMRRSKRVKT